MDYSQYIALKVILAMVVLAVIGCLIFFAGIIAAAVGIILLAVLFLIGRVSWHKELGLTVLQSLTPFYSTYKEYSVAWNGWFGIAQALMPVGIVATLYIFSDGRIALIACGVMALTAIVLRMIESYKLRYTANALNGRNWFLFGLFRGICYIVYAGRRTKEKREARRAVKEAMEQNRY